MGLHSHNTRTWIKIQIRHIECRYEYRYRYKMPQLAGCTEIRAKRETELFQKFFSFASLFGFFYLHPFVFFFLSFRRNIWRTAGETEIKAVNNSNNNKKNGNNLGLKFSNRIGEMQSNTHTHTRIQCIRHSGAKLVEMCISYQLWQTAGSQEWTVTFLPVPCPFPSPSQGPTRLWFMCEVVFSVSHNPPVIAPF